MSEGENKREKKPTLRPGFDRLGQLETPKIPKKPAPQQLS
jgi:hypothetical protein